jgi:hypothetical protein
MPDYKNGKIYQLVCNDTDEIYIGSTALSLEDRLSIHKSPANGCCSKQIIDRNNYYIELLETYPCNNEFELNRKEGEYQRAIECINRNIAGRTKQQYYQDNKEHHNNRSKEHYNENKEYYSNLSKQYHKNNKEYLNEKSRRYHVENRDTIKAYNSKVVICECGIKSTHGHLKRHKLTKLHIDLINLETIKPLVGEVVVCECGSSCVKQQLVRHKRTKKHIDLMNKLNLS